MRTILFRGKVSDEPNEWVYGDFVSGDTIFQRKAHDGSKACDMGMFKVDRKTVGQFAGLTDKNGQMIFEGDIVKGCWGTIFSVYYDVCYLQFRARRSNGSERAIDYYNGRGGLEVIGNIYDNSELLGETK